MQLYILKVNTSSDFALFIADLIWLKIKLLDRPDIPKNWEMR